MKPLPCTDAQLTHSGTVELLKRTFIVCYELSLGSCDSCHEWQWIS